MRRAIILLGCAGVLLSGCAFGTRNVTLKYPPASEDAGRAAAASAPASRTAGKGVVLIRTFADQRADKSVVGEVRNGYGMRTAEVVADNNVVEWVVDAIAKELEHEGVRVLRNGDPERGGDPVISGEVLTVYCKALFSYEGEVSFFASVRKGTEERSRKRYSGNGSAGMNWAATGDSYGKSLSLALQSAVRSLIPDILSVMEND